MDSSIIKLEEHVHGGTMPDFVMRPFFKSTSINKPISRKTLVEEEELTLLETLHIDAIRMDHNIF